MLNWIVEQIWAIVTWVPALFVPEHSPNFVIIRGVLGLILIILILAVIGLLPSAFKHLMRLTRHSVDQENGRKQLRVESRGQIILGRFHKSWRKTSRGSDA